MYHHSLHHAVAAGGILLGAERFTSANLSVNTHEDTIEYHLFFNPFVQLLLSSKLLEFRQRLSSSLRDSPGSAATFHRAFFHHYGESQTLNSPSNEEAHGNNHLRSWLRR